jgi:hypothetical protein
LIGLFSYFKTFIANFFKIARSLMDMLKPENPFMWTSECQQAFKDLKRKTLFGAHFIAVPPRLEVHIGL